MSYYGHWNHQPPVQQPPYHQQQQPHQWLPQQNIGYANPLNAAINAGLRPYQNGAVLPALQPGMYQPPPAFGYPAQPAFLQPTRYTADGYGVSQTAPYDMPRPAPARSSRPMKPQDERCESLVFCSEDTADCQAA